MAFERFGQVGDATLARLMDDTNDNEKEKGTDEKLDVGIGCGVVFEMKFDLKAWMEAARRNEEIDNEKRMKKKRRMGIKLWACLVFWDLVF